MNALVRIARRRHEITARRRALIRWGVPLALVSTITGITLYAPHHPASAGVHHAHRSALRPSPFDRTYTTLTRAIHVGFPQWLAHHPGAWCPDGVRDLMRATLPPRSERLVPISNVDAWDQPMELRCQDTPAGHTIQLRSPGPDGLFDTPDDLFVSR